MSQPLTLERLSLITVYKILTKNKEFGKQIEKIPRIIQQKLFTVKPCCVIKDNMVEAIKNGHLDCVRLIHASKKALEVVHCNLAAYYGKISCLKFFINNGYLFNETTCKAAVQAGQIESLQLLHKHNCPWSPDVCRIAAEYNQLECLKFLHENGCPWDEKTLHASIIFFHYDIFEYLIKHR